MEYFVTNELCAKFQWKCWQDFASKISVFWFCQRGLLPSVDVPRKHLDVLQTWEMFGASNIYFGADQTLIYRETSNIDLHRNYERNSMKKKKLKLWKYFHGRVCMKASFNLKGKYLQHNLTSWSFWSSSLSSLDHQNYSDHDHLQTCCQPLFWKCLFLITIISIIIIITKIMTINYL